MGGLLSTTGNNEWLLPPSTLLQFSFCINIWSHLKGLKIIQVIINNSGLLITYKYAVRCAFIFNMLIAGDGSSFV